MQNTLRRLSCKAIAFVVSLGMLTAPYANTQQIVQEGQRRLLFDHEAHNGNSQGISLENLGSELFGDHIDIDTGELSVRQTDISIPGNSKLPVEYVRYIDSNHNRPNFHGNSTSTISRGMANWSSDNGYMVLSPIKSNGTPGCVSDTTVVDEADEMYVPPMIRLQGESQLLLKTSGASNSAIFGSTQPSYSTISTLRVKQNNFNQRLANNKEQIENGSGEKPYNFYGD